VWAGRTQEQVKYAAQNKACNTSEDAEFGKFDFSTYFSTESLSQRRLGPLPAVHHVKDEAQASDPNYSKHLEKSRRRNEKSRPSSLRSSAVFVSNKPRSEVANQASFERFWYSRPKQEALDKDAEKKPESAACSNAQLVEKHTSGVMSSNEFARPRPSQCAWDKLPERFGILVSTDEFLAVNKAPPPPAPPSTRYEPAAPCAPTIARSARRCPSARPGIRGGIYRGSTTGTAAFM